MAIQELTAAQLLLEQAEEMIVKGSRKALVVDSVTLTPWFTLPEKFTGPDWKA